MTVIGAKPLDGASVLSKAEHLLYLFKYMFYIVLHNILNSEWIF